MIILRYKWICGKKKKKKKNYEKFCLNKNNKIFFFFFDKKEERNYFSFPRVKNYSFIHLIEMNVLQYGINLNHFRIHNNSNPYCI
jgi:hypothetical protein